MTKLKPVPPAPGALEGYAAGFDDLFTQLGQRRGFREYVTGLLTPRERNKTAAALAGAEPVAGSKSAAAQRVQYFLSESCWDPERVNARRLELLLAEAATAPHPEGVLVIDDSGDRKDGRATAHVGRQWLGRLGKTDNGIVTVSTLWADERIYYPLHARPYTPAHHFARGKSDPAFRTKWRIAVELAVQAVAAEVAFRAVVADCAYGDLDDFRGELRRAGAGWVVAVRPKGGTWAYGPDAHTPRDAAGRLRWRGPEEPGDWQPVQRRFRDGHTEMWWAAEASLGFWGPDGLTRLVVVTTDPAALPDKATWYLATNLPRPGGPHDPACGGHSPHPPAGLAEIVRLYGLRHWVEQGYKQVKNELGWADFQVRSDIAIRRHQSLVHCAFSFCWTTWFNDPTSGSAPPGLASDTELERGRPGPIPSTALRLTRPIGTQLAPHATRRPQLADPGHRAVTLVESLVHRAPTT
ncbi:IS701 family transposase [Nonomuraea fuscirosea]|uniref:IS701 family transposase n=1 Tax=Nonomuraea fuscirosea TaxID=1291556 RepID=UPI0034295D7E